MRKEILIIFFVLSTSGCLESQLTPGEAQLCLQSTRVQPSVIPDCTTPFDCEKILRETIATHSFQNISIGAESVLARKGISGAWEKLNRATKTIEHIHSSCATMKADAILPQAVTGASELQNALKASEDAQRSTYDALEKAIWYGKSLELENVKDTSAHQKYSALVQYAYELETNNPTSEWARVQQDNRNYFNHISAIISKNKTQAYQMEWNSLFDVYKTGVLNTAKKQSKGALPTSTLWKGALNAIVGKSKSANALFIATEIRGNEVIEHTEQVVSPENGIISKLWREIIEFDQKITVLKKEEIELERTILDEIDNAKELAQSQSFESKKWESERTRIASWIKVIENKTVNWEGYQSTDEELIEHTSMAERLSDARNKGTESLGKRVSDWRELRRKIEMIVKKIQKNSETNNEWKKYCQKIVDKFSLNKKMVIETPEECSIQLEELKRKENVSADKKNAVEKNSLHACVIELNEWENALEKEITPEEWFDYFGESAASDCESALFNVQKTYENNSIVYEGKEKVKKIKMYEKMLKQLTGNTPKSLFEINGSEPKSLLEWKNLNKELEKNISILENMVDGALNEAAKNMAWKISQPKTILLNEVEEITFRGNFFSNANESAAHAFLVSVPNPGVVEIMGGTEGVQTTIGENDIILEGEFIPKGGVWIEGRGNATGARISKETTHVKTMGSTAFVTQLVVIETNYSPIWAKWKTSESVGTIVKWIKNRTSEKNIEKNENEFFETELTSRENIVEIELEIENSIRTNTRVENSRKEWGKEYIEYHISVENSIPHELEAAIYTGINGDPSVTESVLISNENGERINEALDAAGNIVIPKQQILAKQTREYFLVVEKWEGREEWESIIERLWSEADDLQKKASEKISNTAEKIKEKLSMLRNEKDTIVIAQKLTSIQLEVSKLMEQYEKEEREAAESKSKENQTTIVISKDVEKKENAPVEKNILSQIAHAKSIIVRAQEKMDEYEKSTNVGCEKMALVNFVCPLPDETIRNYKKSISDSEKMIEKMEVKMTKLSEDKQSEEWSLVESEWNKKVQTAGEIVEELDQGLRILRNATVERVEKLKQETKGNTNEEIQSAVAKAADAYENREFGKSIYISQNMLNYLNGNKMTGLLSLPAGAWPFIGIIILVGGWLVWKEWKKRNTIEIPIQTIPKGKIIPREEIFQTNEYGHRSTQEEFPQGRKAEAWKETLAPPTTSEWSEAAVLPSEQKPKWRQKKTKQY